MRRKKKQRLKEEAFWATFFHINVPRHLEEVPDHLERVNFRVCGVDDEGLALMAGPVKSINQLDLDDTDITIEGLRHLARLDYIRELRLKECRRIDNEAMEVIVKIKGLELLHLGGTAINVYGLASIGDLKELKLLLISAAGEEEKELPRIAALLPPGCELIVNHQTYRREKPGEGYAY